MRTTYPAACGGVVDSKSSVFGISSIIELFGNFSFRTTSVKKRGFVRLKA
jgi:hypothetical protein